MAHTMPFTEEMRYELATVVSYSSMALNIPRLALTNYHFFVNKLISGILREFWFCRSEEDGEVYKYEDNLLVKYKYDKRYSTLEVSQPTSTALYPVRQQPHEAIQLGGMAKGRYVVHTPLRGLPFPLFLLQFLKSIGLQPGRSSLFSLPECRAGRETPFHCPENTELSGKADPSDVYMI